jgi:adenosine deaminase
VSLGVFPSLEAHPFAALWEAGVNVTVNSDDPPFFSTTLTQDLGHAARLASLDREGIALLQRRALASSFATEDVKTRLARSIDAWMHGLSS